MSDKQILALFEPGSYEVIPHDGMRRTIAQRLTASVQTVPHFYLTMDCDIGKLLAAREEINASAPKDKEKKPLYKLSGNPQLGWAGLALPEEWGGQGLGTVELAILFEEMGYALAPSPLLSNTIAGLALAAGGSDEQKERWLRPLAEGSLRGTPALIDADGPAEPMRFSMSAGDVLTGEKTLVLDAASADFFLVATADGGRHIVEKGADGVTVTAEESIRPHPSPLLGPLRRRAPGGHPGRQRRGLPPRLPPCLRRARG